MAEIGPAAGGFIAAGWAGRKLLGPLFDEIAEDWRQRYSARRIENLKRVALKAERKLGPRLNKAGEIPPRLVQRVMDEGSWCDHEVMAEYFGGILAASRSEDVNADRGIVWASLVSSLATHDVFLHYLLYDAFRQEYLGRKDLDLGRSNDRESTWIFVPTSGLLTALGVGANPENWSAFVVPSVMALMREALISNRSAGGPPPRLKEAFDLEVSEPGLVMGPSLSGVELFLWAHGHRTSDWDAILDPDLDFTVEPFLGRIEGAQAYERLFDV